MGKLQDLAIRAVDRWVAPGVMEATGRMGQTIVHLNERLAELELAQEDIGWRNLMSSWESEFSRKGLNDISRMCKLMAIKNPLVKRAIEVSCLYTFGQGVTVTAKDIRVNQVVQEFWDDSSNQRALFSPEALAGLEMALWTEGNLFVVTVRDIKTGLLKCRLLPMHQVVEILSDPDDYSCTWYYKRQYQRYTYDYSGNRTESAMVTCYYPDHDYALTAISKPKLWGTTEDAIMWDQPVRHIRSTAGPREMKFGVPEAYAMVDWARAYKEFLEDWATITRALARFLWKYKTDGGDRGVRAARSKMQTTLNATGENISVERNPVPTVGSTVVVPTGKDMDPIKTANITTHPDAGRRVMMMASAASGLPETFFGDVSIGNHATSKTLDRPTELKFKFRQTIYSNLIRALVDDQLASSVAAPGNVISKKKLVKTLTDTVKARLEEAGLEADALTVNGDGSDDAVEGAGGGGDEVERTVVVSMPSILEDDIVAQIGAVVDAATLKGFSSAGVMDHRMITKMCLEALGVEELDEVLEALYGEDYNEQQDLADQQAPSPVPPGLAGQGDGEGGGEGGGDQGDGSLVPGATPTIKPTTKPKSKRVMGKESLATVQQLRSHVTDAISRMTKRIEKLEIAERGEK